MASSKLVYRHQTYAGTVCVTAALVLALVILPVVSTWMFADGAWQAAATSADKPTPDGGKGNGSSGGKGNSSGGKGQGNGGGGQGFSGSSGGSGNGGGSSSGNTGSGGAGQGSSSSSGAGSSGNGSSGSSSGSGGNSGNGGSSSGSSTGGSSGDGAGSANGASGAGSGDASSGGGTSGGGAQEGGNDAGAADGAQGGHDGDESSVVGLARNRAAGSGADPEKDSAIVLVAPANEIWETIEDTYCGCDMPRGYKGCVPIFTEAQCRHITGPGAWTDAKEEHYQETFPILLRAALIERQLLTPEGLVRQRPKAAEGLDNVEASNDPGRFNVRATPAEPDDGNLPDQPPVSQKRSRVGLFSRLRQFFAGA